MDQHFDLIIRGGTVFDGTGAEPFAADVGVRSGSIAALGDLGPHARGREEIDAKHKLVTPGFVDVHTHYDGQATWDSRLAPSSLHGVTTVIIGNCGVGFAPCRPDDHERLIRLMEGVEDIPFPVLTQGLPWTWQSFGEYLDHLEARHFDVDIGAQLPHAALRVFAMGERGAKREPATPDDVATMRALATQAAHAGALGFSTSRTLNHRGSDGAPTPTLTAAEDELLGIALGFADAGRGVLQFVSDFHDPHAEFAMLRRLVERSGRPLSFSLAQSVRAPEQWRVLLDGLADANAHGLPMKAQVAGRPIGLLFGLELTRNPFSHHPTYRAIAKLPLAERVRQLRQPGLRERLLQEESAAAPGFVANLPHAWSHLYILGDPPDYEQPQERCLAALAAASGKAPAAIALDHLLDGDGRGMLYAPLLNYAHGSLDACHAMLSHPDCMPGLSDGGAHVGTICDGSFPTTNLTHWTRDRTRGPKLPLAQMIHMQTQRTARALSLFDRGQIAIGMRADLNVIDYDRLRVLPPEVQYDLPAGGRRLMQRARGYEATIVAGDITYREGEATGALPGRLVRGPQFERSAAGGTT